MKRKLWGSPITAEAEHVVDVIDEVAKLVRDATALGHADGERNWPPPASGAPTEAETTLRARSQQLMLTTTRCCAAELTRAQHAVAAAVARYRSETQRLPDVVRQAKAVFDEHAAQIESPLLEAARHAEAAQRKKRSEELLAGVSFDGTSAGAFPLMLAVLLFSAVCESALTTLMISDSHPGGMLGAAGLAATVAGLQLAYAFSVGHAARAMFDRAGPMWRAMGGTVGAAGVAGLVLGHLVVGRFRELTLAIDFETAMQRAVPDVLVRHVLPTEFSAVLLTLVGIFCGLSGILVGVRRVDNNRAEHQGKVASEAEAALEAFRQVRAEVEDSNVAKQACALIDALEAQVAQVHRELGEAVHQWDMRRASLHGLQGELVNAYRMAIEGYRVRVARIHSDSVPAHWAEPQAFEALSAPVIQDGHADIDAARALLAEGQFAQVLDAARQELDRAARNHAHRRSQRIAQLEDVIYRDWYRPADGQPQRTPAAQLVPVGEVRRMVTQA